MGATRTLNSLNAQYHVGPGIWVTEFLTSAASFELLSVRLHNLRAIAGNRNSLSFLFVFESDLC
jgi:hypothetical protein